MGSGEPLTDERILIGKHLRVNPLNEGNSIHFWAADSVSEIPSVKTTSLSMLSFGSKVAYWGRPK